MHTDEYEISLGREIAHCRKRVRRLQDSLGKREQQYGMTTAAFLQAQATGGLADDRHKRAWNQEYQELQYWQKTLTEYETALKNLE